MNKREIELDGKRIIEKSYTGTYCGDVPHFNWITIAEFKNKRDAEISFQAIKQFDEPF